MAEEGQKSTVSLINSEVKAAGLQVKPTIDNFYRLITDHYRENLRMNEMTGKPEYYDRLMKRWREWTDAQESEARAYFESQYSMYSQAKLADALTIYCYTGSYAQSFAVAQSIPYVLLDGALKGAADGNGKINIADVTAIQRHLADIEPLRGVSLYFADVDGDGSVTVLDATEIQRYLAEFIEAL